ncbi:DUF4251 domain-containing protein [Psychroflexus montanilacus]|uniref:DUF4251 domain-containing protein n=1 Tax=Psychroflexus montanilacus TaxID=2873598 RepID=UPI001CCEE332|nr:DUF4251 domain-containing protein [Psychroflexus montanilacus]MBZ9650489.1 DUF4251 domain-containing protein [Psychroflexus montanilacus]
MKFNFKSIQLFFTLLGVVAMFSCEIQREVSSEDKARLDKIIEDRYFEIEADVARPLVTNALNQLANAGLYRPGDNAAQINLQGNSNYFRFEGDSVSADLPYYGERQMGGGYNSNSGIEFEGVPKNLKIEKEADKNEYSIKFDIKEDSENYQVTLTIYSNLKALINVNSSQRFPIRYDGTIKALELPEEKK